MPCPRCAAPTEPGASFCDECGARLESGCPSCGAANRHDAKFCRNCGARRGAAAPDTYTPKHLAEKILTSRGALEGERKQVTVLFADIKGSMELLADRDPEDARALLDPVLARMMEAVHFYEGTVNQVLGDGIMALFGAPVAHEDHAVRACYAALRMQEALLRYVRETPGLGDVPLLVRVGINSGEVVVRAIGNDLHMDYTAVGQTTHLAARMEQTAQAGTILATASTVDLVKGFIETRALGPVRVKGLETAIEVYEVVRITRARSRLQAAPATALTPFVGRVEEKARLQAALDRAFAGRGQVVVVTGEPGVGKSRLFFELAHSPAVGGWTVLESVVVAYGKTTPFLPVLDLLRAYFRIEARDDAATVREKVRAAVAVLDPALDDAVAPLLALLEVLPEDDPLRVLDPPERRRRTLDAVRRLLLRESRVHPVLIALENFQWVDSQTRALFDDLLDPVADARVLLLISHRPEFEIGWAARPHMLRLRLEPLSPEHAEDLLSVLLGDDPALDPLKRLLIDRIGGNPFFLEECVRSLVETRVLVGERGAHHVSDRSPSVQIPATVQAIVASRIDRLALDDKRLLQAASIIGRETPLGLLEAVGELQNGELHEALDRLQGARFLHARGLAPDVEYVFTHGLTHEVAYGSILLERRRTLHALVAETMERQGSARGAEQLDRLAYHAFRGEQWEKAATYYRLAGARAVTRAANAEAVTCFEHALKAVEKLPESPVMLAQSVDLRLDLRSPLLQLGRLQEVLSRSLEAERLARRLGDVRRLASVYTYLINYHYLKGEPELAIEYGERCLAIARADGDHALQNLAARYMGHIHHTCGDYRRAQKVFTENVEQLEGPSPPGEPAAVSIAYAASTAWLAFTLAELGDFDFAEAYIDKAQQAADADRHAYSQAIAWTLAGLVRIRQGRFDEAREPLERALATCRERQLAIWQPIPSSLLGLTLTVLGRKDEGLRLLESGVSLSEALGVRAYLALWTVHLGEGLLISGFADRARAAGEAGLGLATAHRERGHQAWALRLLGEVAERQEPPDLARAETCYGQALEIAHELGMRPLMALCHLALGQFHCRLRNRPRAEEHLALATELFCEMETSYWPREAQEALRDLGRLFIVARDHPALHAYLTRAFAGDGRVRVILDRREGTERRQHPNGYRGERRQGDDRRKRLDVDISLRDRPIVVIE